MRGRNLVTRLPRRRRAGGGMEAFDRLPPVLRGWIAGAALPWSAQSVARIWTRALRETRSEAAALARLEAVQAATLRRDRAGGAPPP